MIRQKQLNNHDPKNGVWGDCYRTCIACLLNMPNYEVPHFCDEGSGDSSEGAKTVKEKVKKWLDQKGYTLLEFCYTGCDLKTLLHVMEHFNPGALYMLTGQSGKHRDTGHVVICKGGELYWDPSPFDLGVSGPWYDEDLKEHFWTVEFIVKKDGIYEN